MTKCYKAGNWLICSLIGATYGLMVEPAFAGTWGNAPIKTSKNVQGIPWSERMNGSTVVSGASGSTTKNWVNGWFLSSGANPAMWPSGPGHLVGTQSGTATIWLKYTPSSPTDVPPNRISVRVHLTGEVSADEGQPDPGLTATNYAKAVAISIRGHTGDQPILSPDGRKLKTNLDKWILVQASPQLRDDGFYYASIPFPVNNSVTLQSSRVQSDSTPFTAGSIGAEFGISGQKDTRFVTLTRDNAINEWETLDGNVVVRHGDTTYSNNLWTSQSGGGYITSPQPNLQTFRSTLSGDWATTFANYSYDVQRTWVLPAPPLAESYGISGIPNTSESEDGQTGIATASRVLDFGNLVKATDSSGTSVWVRAPQQQTPSFYEVFTQALAGSPRSPHPRMQPRPPLSVTVKHFAKDNNDGAVAEARYALTAHEPYEIVSEEILQPPESVVIPVYVHGSQVHEVGENYNSSYLYPVIRNGPMQSSLFGTSSVSVKTRGYAIGVEGGGDIHAIPELLGLNFSINGQRTSEISVETGYYQEITFPAIDQNHFAYAFWKIDFERHLTKYRRYSPAGELRRSGSPSVPAPSLPYTFNWELAGLPQLGFEIFDKGLDDPPVIEYDNIPPVAETSENSG